MSKLVDILSDYGADIEGIMERFAGDDEFYESCLKQFVTETGFEELKRTVQEKAYQEAFEQAHALKGVSGNLGLTPLYDKICILVESLRNGQYGEVDQQETEVETEWKKFLETWERATE